MGEKAVFDVIDVDEQLGIDEEGFSRIVRPDRPFAWPEIRALANMHHRDYDAQ